MPKKCLLCRALSSPFEERSFHAFPKDEILRNKWIESLKLTNRVLNFKTANICSDHFDDNLFYDHGELHTRSRLYPHAVPQLINLTKQSTPLVSDNNNFEEHNLLQDTNVDEEAKFPIDMVMDPPNTEEIDLVNDTRSQSSLSSTSTTSKKKSKKKLNSVSTPSQTASMVMNDSELDYYKKKYIDNDELDSVKYEKFHCTSCDKHLGSAPSKYKLRFEHPLLKVLVCESCLKFYSSGEFEKGDDGSEMYCRWCGQGGQVYCCSKCPFVFCKKCIRKNMGSKMNTYIESIDDWLCFACNPQDLWALRASYRALKNFTQFYIFNHSTTGEDYEKDYSGCCKNRGPRHGQKQINEMFDKDNDPKLKLKTEVTIEILPKDIKAFVKKEMEKKRKATSPIKPSKTNKRQRVDINQKLVNKINEENTDEVVCTPDILPSFEDDTEGEPINYIPPNNSRKIIKVLTPNLINNQLAASQQLLGNTKNTFKNSKFPQSSSSANVTFPTSMFQNSTNLFQNQVNTFQNSIILTSPNSFQQAFITNNVSQNQQMVQLRPLSTNTPMNQQVITNLPIVELGSGGNNSTANILQNQLAQQSIFPNAVHLTPTTNYVTNIKNILAQKSNNVTKTTATAPQTVTIKATMIPNVQSSSTATGKQIKKLVTNPFRKLNVAIVANPTPPQTTNPIQDNNQSEVTISAVENPTPTTSSYSQSNTHWFNRSLEETQKVGQLLSTQVKFLNSKQLSNVTAVQAECLCKSFIGYIQTAVDKLEAIKTKFLKASQEFTSQTPKIIVGKNKKSKRRHCANSTKKVTAKKGGNKKPVVVNLVEAKKVDKPPIVVDDDSDNSDCIILEKATEQIILCSDDDDDEKKTNDKSNNDNSDKVDDDDHNKNDDDDQSKNGDDDQSKNGDDDQSKNGDDDQSKNDDDNNDEFDLEKRHAKFLKELMCENYDDSSDDESNSKKKSSDVKKSKKLIGENQDDDERLNCEMNDSLVGDGDLGSEKNSKLSEDTLSDLDEDAKKVCDYDIDALLNENNEDVLSMNDPFKNIDVSKNDLDVNGKDGSCDEGDKSEVNFVRNEIEYKKNNLDEEVLLSSNENVEEENETHKNEKENEKEEKENAKEEEKENEKEEIENEKEVEKENVKGKKENEIEKEKDNEKEKEEKHKGEEESDSLIDGEEIKMQLDESDCYDSTQKSLTNSSLLMIDDDTIGGDAIENKLGDKNKTNSNDVCINETVKRLDLDERNDDDDFFSCEISSDEEEDGKKNSNGFDKSDLFDGGENHVECKEKTLADDLMELEKSLGFISNENGSNSKEIDGN